jgi:hypothetical protein
VTLIQRFGSALNLDPQHALSHDCVGQSVRVTGPGVKWSGLASRTRNKT